MVWVVAKPRSSEEGLVVWAPLVLFSPPEVLAVSAGLALHWAALAPVAQMPQPVAQMPQEKPRAGSVALYCNALVMESLGA